MAELTAATKALLSEATTATLTTQLFKRGLRNTFIQGVVRLTAPALSSAPHSLGDHFQSTARHFAHALRQQRKSELLRLILQT